MQLRLYAWTVSWRKPLGRWADSPTADKHRVPKPRNRKGAKARRPKGKPTKRRPTGSPTIGQSVQKGVGALSTLFSLGKSAFRAITGRGDYTTDLPIRENSILKPLSFEAIKEATPELAVGGVRVKHREYLMDISTGEPTGVGTGPFFTSIVLNPADARTFPFLHTVAQNFSQYMLMGCVFEFVSTCGNAVSSTNSALGSLTFAAQYDVNTRPFLDSKRRIANHFWAISGAPSRNMTIPIECAKGQSIAPLFIRSQELKDGYHNPITGVAAAETADARLYDHCRLEILGIGSQARFIAGELWVTYDVVLMKPRLSEGAGVTFTPPAEFLVPEAAYQAPVEVPEVQVVLLNEAA